MVVTTSDMLELRSAGLDALNAALGPERAQAFLRYWGRAGSGDFTKERHERPERSNEEIFADITRLQEARKEAGGRLVNA